MMLPGFYFLCRSSKKMPTGRDQPAAVLLQESLATHQCEMFPSIESGAPWLLWGTWLQYQRWHSRDYPSLANKCLQLRWALVIHISARGRGAMVWSHNCFSQMKQERWANRGTLCHNSISFFPWPLSHPLPLKYKENIDMLDQYRLAHSPIFIFHLFPPWNLSVWLLSWKKKKNTKKSLSYLQPTTLCAKTTMMIFSSVNRRTDKVSVK